jgi:hypothetical protein
MGAHAAAQRRHAVRLGACALALLGWSCASLPPPLGGADAWVTELDPTARAAQACGLRGIDYRGFDPVVTPGVPITGRQALSRDLLFWCRMNGPFGRPGERLRVEFSGEHGVRAERLTASLVGSKRRWSRTFAAPQNFLSVADRITREPAGRRALGARALYLRACGRAWNRDAAADAPVPDARAGVLAAPMMASLESPRPGEATLAEGGVGGFVAWTERAPDARRGRADLDVRTAAFRDERRPASGPCPPETVVSPDAPAAEAKTLGALARSPVLPQPFPAAVRAPDGRWACVRRVIGVDPAGHDIGARDSFEVRDGRKRHAPRTWLLTQVRWSAQSRRLHWTTHVGYDPGAKGCVSAAFN